MLHTLVYSRGPNYLIWLMCLLKYKSERVSELMHGILTLNNGQKNTDK